MLGQVAGVCLEWRKQGGGVGKKTEEWGAARVGLREQGTGAPCPSFLRLPHPDLSCLPSSCPIPTSWWRLASETVPALCSHPLWVSRPQACPGGQRGHPVSLSSGSGACILQSVLEGAASSVPTGTAGSGGGPAGAAHLWTLPLCWASGWFSNGSLSPRMRLDLEFLILNPRPAPCDSLPISLRWVSKAVLFREAFPHLPMEHLLSPSTLACLNVFSACMDLCYQSLPARITAWGGVRAASLEPQHLCVV